MLNRGRTTEDWVKVAPSFLYIGNMLIIGDDLVDIAFIKA
jgi:hypothetical protein